LLALGLLNASTMSGKIEIGTKLCLSALVPFSTTERGWTMRILIACTLTMALTFPVHAQIEDDFAFANRIFGQISAESVTSDINGEWLPLSTLSNLNGADPDPGLVESYLERICGNDPARGALLASISDTSFEMAAANSRGDLIYRFDWLGGAQFHRSFDPDTLFNALALDESERGAAMRAGALEATTSLVDFYRVSPDLLVMATPKRVEIFGRCPA
jgi:hypothetical protein